MPVQIRTSRLRKDVKKYIRGALSQKVLPQILVSQAKRRIDQRGDSQHTYAELWDHPSSYRSGGHPLKNTGLLYNSLSAESKSVRGGVRLVLRSPYQHAIYHQHGFTTTGPNFIPLNRKGVRRGKGLKFGKDFIIAPKGVTVPQRKIFNTPPEDMAEIAISVRKALRRAAHGN